MIHTHIISTLTQTSRYDFFAGMLIEKIKKLINPNMPQHQNNATLEIIANPSALPTKFDSGVSPGGPNRIKLINTDNTDVMNANGKVKINRIEERLNL